MNGVGHRKWDDRRVPKQREHCQQDSALLLNPREAHTNHETQTTAKLVFR